MSEEGSRRGSEDLKEFFLGKNLNWQCRFFTAEFGDRERNEEEREFAKRRKDASFENLNRKFD